jgi:UDP-glucose 4-epimerase
MRIVVTGGAGFIGSHLTELLLSEGHSVTVVDNLVTGLRENLPKHPNLEFIEKDIKECTPKDFSSEVDAIAHLAATPSVNSSWQLPLENHHQNLSASVAVIQLCQSLNISRVAFASSAAVYGNPCSIPISELTNVNPLSPYGLQKLVSEQYFDLFARQANFSVVNLRLFNVFGPRQRPDSHYSGVISIFTKLMSENSPITIYGDGTQTRDFVYVKDVVFAFKQALTVPLESGKVIKSNIGTGKAISLIELAEELKHQFRDWNSDIIFKSSRAGDIQFSLADISAAASILNYKPQFSLKLGLEQLLKSLDVLS